MELRNKTLEQTAYKICLHRLNEGEKQIRISTSKATYANQNAVINIDVRIIIVQFTQIKPIKVLLSQIPFGG